jgi:ribosome-associated translation inhibitor RaiA
MQEQALAIDIEGVERGTMLRSRAVKVLEGTLRTIGLSPVKAKITFFDDNGPKGGRGMRCALSVRLPYRPAIHVEQLAETSRLAFDGAFAALERRLERYRERDRDIKRRPKKYFVAKRLLVGDLGRRGASRRIRRRKEV